MSSRLERSRTHHRFTDPRIYSVLKYVLTGLQVLQNVAIIGRAFGIVALRPFIFVAGVCALCFLFFSVKVVGVDRCLPSVCPVTPVSDV
jgi:hypothetical protein